MKILILTSFLLANFALARSTNEHKKERLLVKFQSNVSEEEIKQKLNNMNSSVEHKIKGAGIHVVKLPPGLDENEALEKLKLDDQVKFVELDMLIAPDEILANDTYFANQWGPKKISAPFAWDITTGSSEVIIAILDAGVDGTHPDLAAKMVPGKNIVDGSAITSDVSGHGTRVAGVAAAIGGNSLGVAGICWSCKIMPLRISNDPSGYAYWSTVASAITYAADNGARVVNNSYASFSSASVQSAAQYLKSKGGVFIASAGNDNALVSGPLNPNYMLVVSATGTNDEKASWSSYGPVVTNSAPGVGIYTTSKGGGYGAASGTSFAAPMTAGSVALLFAAKPSLTAGQAIQIIKDSSDDLGVTGRDDIFGAGRVNIERGVQMALSATVILTPIDGACGSSNGKILTSEPSTNLCTSGLASAVTLSSNIYRWSCSGMNGGISVNCQATYSAPDTTPPTAPGSLVGSVIQIKSGNGKRAVLAPAVQLSWNASTDNKAVSSYQIIRNGSVLGSTSSLSFTDKNVSKGLTYIYTVHALDAAANKSAGSNSVSIPVN